MREAEQAKLLADEEEKRRLEEALRQDREQLERIREQHARSRAEMAAAGAAAGAEDDGFVMGENAEADDEYRPGAAKRARARKAKRAAGDGACARVRACVRVCVRCCVLAGCARSRSRRCRRRVCGGR
jgi:hypothetical protein